MDDPRDRPPHLGTELGDPFDPYQPPAAHLEATEAAPTLDLAGPGPRALAAAVDVGLFACVWFAATMVVQVAGAELAAAEGVFQLVMYAVLLGMFVFFAAMEASPLSASPGKLLAGLQVVELDGAPVSVLGALKRNLFKTFVLLCCCWVLGFFILLERGSGPWDSAANTRVVVKRPPDQLR